MSTTAPELAYFRKALGSFVKSATKFDVVSSVRGTGPNALSPLAPPARPRSQVHTLVILDSSFNPPSVAHMQMATSAVRDLRRQHRQQLQQQQQSVHPVAMRLLLLLSVNNADKVPKPAAFEQRLSMMLAMAQDMQAILEAEAVEIERTGEAASPSPSSLPIDIGLTSEPYFHNKSNAIAASPFYTRPALDPAGPEQVFLVGYDTLVRVFDPKYYAAPPPPGTPRPDSLPADATPMQLALTPLMRRARLRVTTRPDDQWGDEAAQRAWLHSVGELGGGEDWAAKIDLVSGAFQGAAIVSSTTARAAAKAHDWALLGTQVGPAVRAWVETQRLYSE